MASPKVRLEGKKIAEKVMDFIDMKSFDPIHNGRRRGSDRDIPGEIKREIPSKIPYRPYFYY